MIDQFTARFAEQLRLDYTIERELGGGTMSRVYVVRDTSHQRLVVIKALPPEYAAGVNADRFRREISLTTALQHPNIVPVLRAGKTKDGVLYYAMPFIEGRTLRERLTEGAFTVPQTVGLLLDIVLALDFAHRMGVLHRDLKPDNILLTDNKALVADFGIAKAFDSAGLSLMSASLAVQALTNAGESIGTPHYMSPEQVNADQEIDAKSDLYALGIIAYELTTGQLPFSGSSMRALMIAHLAGVPKHVDELAPGIPVELSNLIMRCLEKNTSDRPATAQEIADTLQMLLARTTPQLPAPFESKQSNPIQRIS